jgi:DNA replication protein DnaC
MDMSVQMREAVCPEHGAFESRSVVLMGRSIGWSKCPECNRIADEKQAEERRQRDEQERQRRIEVRLNTAGIPMRFRSRSFSNFATKTKPQADCLRYAEGFAETFIDRLAEGTTAVFSGLPGTGKSHLAIAVCQAVMSAGYTALYLNALDAIRLVRSTWRRDSERAEADVMDDLTNVDLLVLDEVGAQYGTEGEQVVLFDIINRRYQDQKPMILLTNQGKDGFRQYLGDRAFDRLRESGRWLAFDWESHRGSAA